MRAELKKRIEERTAHLAVIGLGYVGLPVAALFAKHGFDVTGVDILLDRVNKINSGISPIEGIEPGLQELISETVRGGKLKATLDYASIADCDVVLIDVETPVNKKHFPEYEALKGALDSLGAILKAGTLVVVESTIMPGTMEQLVKPALEESSGLRSGIDFFLGNCPERVMPGRLLHNLQKMNRVAGGDSPETAALMKALYAQVVEADVDECDWITAELVKTVENAYRDVNIAFANEVALICEALKADVWRVRELVRKSPGREMLKPGAGVGGHCIPKDPWLLAASIHQRDFPLRLIPAARSINDYMPQHMMKLLQQSLGVLKGKKVLILGYAYLEDSDDTRSSPAEVLKTLLSNEGAKVVVHDPFIKEYVGDVLKKARGCDAAVLVTAHSYYKQLDLKTLGQAMRTSLLVDGRGLWDRTTVIEAGLKLSRLGGAISVFREE